MLKAIVIVFLASCVDTSVDSGTVWKCSAVFECDGQTFDISTSTGCADDSAEALALYELRLDVITKDARCVTRSYAPVCVDTGDRCVASGR